MERKRPFYKENPDLKKLLLQVKRQREERAVVEEQLSETFHQIHDEYVNLFEDARSCVSVSKIIQLCQYDEDFYLRLDQEPEPDYPHDLLFEQMHVLPLKDVKEIITSLMDPQHPLARCIKKYSDLAYDGVFTVQKKLFHKAMNSIYPV